MKSGKTIKLNERNILLIIIAVLLLMAVTSFCVQYFSEFSAFKMPDSSGKDADFLKNSKSEAEIYKLAAEIRHIRSDTEGSLFWLKLVALFVTVGGAVGGYLVTQKAITKSKLNFELRKSIDETYQKIIQELAAAEPVLRAASAVKLGAILQNFPKEWISSEDRTDADKRREELLQLTRQVLSAALAIEKNEKVLKTITIALARKEETAAAADKADLRRLDLSWANANDAYWAKIDFSYADFFRASLSKTSFKEANLTYTSFYHADLSYAVLKKADCSGAYFNFADLRYADLTGIKIDAGTNFEGAKVYGLKLLPENSVLLKDAIVDVSRKGDGSSMKMLLLWLLQGDNADG